MSWERDLKSWERDKYFFSHVPSVLPYKYVVYSFLFYFGGVGRGAVCRVAFTWGHFEYKTRYVYGFLPNILSRVQVYIWTVFVFFLYTLETP